MKANYRIPSEETLAMKVPTVVADHIKRAAREDDRTVSAWMRRHFAELFGLSLKPQTPHEGEGPR